MGIGKDKFSIHLSKTITLSIDYKTGKVSLNDSVGGGEASYDPSTKEFKSGITGLDMTFDKDTGDLAFSTGIFSGSAKFATKGLNQGKISNLTLTMGKGGASANVDVDVAWPTGGVVVTGKGTVDLAGKKIWDHNINVDLGTVQKFTDFFGFTTASWVNKQLQTLVNSIAEQTGDTIPTTSPAASGSSTPSWFEWSKVPSVPGGQLPPGGTQVQIGNSANIAIAKNPAPPRNPADGYTVIVDAFGAIVAGGQGADIRLTGGITAELGAQTGTTMVYGGSGNNAIKGYTGTFINYCYGDSFGNGSPEIDTITPNGAKGIISYVVGTSSPLPLTGPGDNAIAIQKGNLITWISNDGKNTQYQLTLNPNSNTGQLVISGGVLGDGQIIINDFDLSQAVKPNGDSFGIHVPQDITIIPDESTSLPANIPTGVVAAGTSQTITVRLLAPCITATNVTLAVAGGSGLFLNTGADTTPVSGSFTVTIPAGQNSVTFGLIDSTVSSAPQVVTLTASMDGDSGSSNTATVTFNGTPDPAKPIVPDTVIQPDGTGDVWHYRGDGGNDIIIGGGSKNSIDGGTGSDSIVGGAGNDTIFAGDGNDTVNAGNGGSSVYLGNGNDSISAGTGNDTINSGKGNSTISGGGGQDIIIVGNGNNHVFAGSVVTLGAALSAHQTASGTKGAFLAAGDGNNTIVGGTGNDVISVGTGNNTIVCGPGSVTVIGGIEVTGVQSTWSTTDSANNTIFNNVDAKPASFSAPAGYEGATFNGVPYGTGNDTIYGGTGNSEYWLANGNNYLDAGGGNDYIEASTGNNTIFGGAGNDTIFGGGGNDYIDAESGNDSIVGQGGDSTIFGGTGNDIIFAGDNTSWATSQATSNVYLEAGSGDTALFGAGGNDTLIGGSGNSSLFGGDGNEDIEAGSGNTLMGAGKGNDTLIGGSGSDTISGGDGNDVISAGDGGTQAAPTVVQAGSGSTTITGGAGIDQIFGGSGADVIYAGDGGNSVNATRVTAGTGNTTIYGGGGVDIISVGSGSDLLVAGSGTNTFLGGAGTATYEIDSSSGDTTILNANAGDTLKFGAGITVAGIAASMVQLTGGGIAYVLTLDTGATVTILQSSLTQVTFADGETVTLAQLSAPSFSDGTATYSQVSNTLPTVTGGSSSGPKQTLALTGSADISATGNNVNDVLTANSGNDTLVAGTANDTLVGGGASENYVVSAATGTVTTIDSSSKADTLSLTSGISLANLSVNASTAADGSLIVNLQNSQGGSVVVTGDTSGNMLDTISFADGGTASLGTLLAQITTGPTAATSAASVTLAAGIRNMTLTGTANITATGNAQANVITANSGNDTLIAGTGNDTLNGGGGTATYVFNQGDANITITNSGSTDTLSLGAGISERDLTVSSTSVNGVTVVTIADDQGGSITLQGGALNQASFANGDTVTLTQLLSGSYTEGTTLYSAVNAIAGAGINVIDLTGTASVSATANALNDVIAANSGSDTLIAGTGNDTLIGGGFDTYVIAAGTQVTTIQQSGISDILSFGAGVSLANLSATAATAADGSTVITLQNSAGGSVVIDASATGPVDQINFADGSTASLSAILAQATTGITAATSAATVTLAAGIQNMILTGSGNLAATGNSLDDVITANSGNDTLIAGTANDTLVGGAGATTYAVNVGSTNVTIINSGSADTLAFGAGIAETDLNASSAVVNGVKVVTITDGHGDSVAINGGGLSQVSFADGSSTTLSQLLLPSSTTGTTTVSSVSTTAGTGVTTLTMTGSANVTATANTLNVTITSNNGNDTLIAGSGNDTLVGGIGNTTYAVDITSGVTTIKKAGNADILSFGAGISITNLSATAAIASDGSTILTIADTKGNAVVIDDYVYGALNRLNFADGSSASLSALLAQATTGSTATTSAFSLTTLPQGIQNLTLTGNADVTITGNNLDDVITGNSGNDSIYAGFGNDSLIAGSGNTSLGGGVGNDTLVGGSGNDTLVAGPGNTTIIGGSGTDLIAGGAGNNVLSAGNGGTAAAPTKVGATSGNATITGGLGFDFLTGGSGNDVIVAGNGGHDTMSAGSGNDTLTGNSNAVTDYIITASSGNVTITNSSSADALVFGSDINASDVTDTITYVNGVANVTYHFDGGKTVTVQGGALQNVSFDSNNTGSTIVRNSAGSTTINNYSPENANPTTEYVYLTNNIYSRGLSNGTWTSITNNLSSMVIGADGTLTPLVTYPLLINSLTGGSAGKFFYGTYQPNTYYPTVASFSVNSDGTIALTGFTGYNDPVNGIAVAPSGQYVYTANSLPGNRFPAYINQYTISPNGALVPMTVPSVTVSGSPASTGNLSNITIDPSGNYLYVVDNYTDSVHFDQTGTGAILEYAIGPNGALTPMATPSVAIDGLIANITVDPAGKFVLVQQGQGVMEYAIGANGELNSMGWVAGGTNADARIAFDPTGKYVYMTSGSALYQFTIDAVGALTPMSVAAINLPFGASGYAFGMTVDPSGKYVYVTGETSTGSCEAQYAIGADGELSPMAQAVVNRISGPGEYNRPGNIIAVSQNTSGMTSHVLTSDQWANADGSYGTDSYNIDGVSSSGTTHYADGSVGTYTDDGITYTTSGSATAPGNIVNLTGSGTANIALTGNTLNDVISANNGNDTLIAGTGNDTLRGGSGATTYEYNSGAGNVVIANSGSADTLQFGAGIAAGNLSVSAPVTVNGLQVVTIQVNGGDSITIDGGGLTQLRFADGSTTTLSAFQGASTSSSVSVALPDAATNLTLTGSANLSATGNAQNDVITANSGNDTLIAGSGNDTLSGGGGTATYEFNQGAGNTTIVHSGSADTLVFGAGITEGDLTTTSKVINNAVVVTIVDSLGGQVVVQGGGLSQVNFADGSTATLNQLLAPSYTEGTTMYSRISATAGAGIVTLDMTASATVATANNLNDVISASYLGDNTLVGGTGNDTLIGSTANTYVISSGTQVTTIQQSSANDWLDFGAGVSASDLSATAATAADGSTVVTIHNDQGGTVVIDASVNGIVDQINFANGTTASVTSLLAQATTGITAATSAVNVTLPSGIQNMILTGTGNLTATGNNLADVITANNGSDTLIAGSGNDTLVGGNGDDLFVVGPAHTILGSSTPATDTFAVIKQGWSVIYDVGTQGRVAFNQSMRRPSNKIVIRPTVLPQVNVLLAAGISASQLQFTWGSFDDGSGTLHQTLNVGWGNDSGMRVVIANPGDGNGSNNEQFQFADGTVLTLAQMLALAPPQPAAFDAGPTLTAALPDQAIDGQILAQTPFSYVIPQHTFLDDKTVDGVTYAVTMADGSALPSWLAFDPKTNTLSSSAAPTTNGTFAVNVTATDPNGLSATTSLNLTVTNAGATAITSAVSTVMSDQAISLTLTGSAAISGTGNSLADTITGNSGNDTLIAGSGLATLIGGSGNDTFVVDNAGDVVQALAGSNTILTSVSYSAAANVQNLIGTGTANLTLTGNNLADTITANSGDDTLIAGSGVATLVGGSGNDTFVVDNTADVITAQTGVGTNTVQTSVSYTLAANLQNLTAIGTAALTLTGNNLTNVITGNAGNDTLVAGSGVATLIGNSGNDTFVVNNTGDTVSELGVGNSTILTSVDYVLPSSVQNLSASGSNALTLTGNSGNDVLTANSGADTLIAGAGNDTLISGTGIDALVGGSGNDTFVVNNASDVITEAANSGNNTEQTSVSVTLAENVQNLTGIGSANLTLTGNDQANTITANGGNDTLVAGSGIATLIGGSGNDTFVINNTGDVVNAQAGGTNTVQTSINYTLGANQQNLTATGTAALTLTGNNLTNVITGNAGNDTLIAGSGIATLIGNSGNDTFVVDNSGDTVTETQGGTSNVQSSVSFTLSANLQNLTGTGSANLTLTGNNLADVITGNAGADTLVAGSGNDTLIAGSGLATLVGGVGNDTFVINNAGDVITEAVNTGNNTEQTSVSATLAANVQNLSGTGSANLSLTGNGQTDVISANSGNDTLIAGGGIATLVGGSGNDTLTGNGGGTAAAATFVVNAGDGNINIVNSAGSDILTFGVGIAIGSIAASSTGTGSSTVVTLMIAGGDTITIANPAFTKVDFADGTTSTLAALLAQSTISSAVNIVMPAGTTTLTLTGSANISATGNNLPDVITANSGNDTLIAGSGLATLIGGSGNDTFVINNAADVINEAVNTGKNTEQSSVSTTLAANVQNLKGIGTGDLTLTGNNLANVITANSGADTLIAGSGLATLVGGSGNDTFVINNASDVISKAVNTGNNTELTSVSVKLATNVQNLTGTGSANLTLTGNTLANVITANSGNDTLVAGTGLATLVGGSGNDTFVVDNANDVIVEAANTGNNTERTSVSITLAANVQNLIATGSAALTLTGNSQDDTITGNSGADTLVAGSGNDTLIAGSGLTTLVGGAGNDTFVINNAGDVISEAVNSGNNTERTSVSTTLAANVQNLTGTGTGNLTLTGNNLANVITANAGRDTLVSGTGIDTLVGGSGNDTFVVNNAADVIVEAANVGKNLEQASVSVTLAANVQNLTGIGSGDLTLTGNNLANVITANSGNDTLIAGSGLATLVGGNGNDTFIINNASDVVTKAVNTGSNTEQTSVSVKLANNVQNLTGTGSANLILTGNTLANVITANSGNDTLIAGSGVATLVGGSGNDTFVINNVNDVITEAANSGNNTEQTSVSTTLAANVQNLIGTGSAALTLTGNSQAATITANGGQDTLVAGSGIDTLVGGSGNDTFVINNAGDVIIKSANTGKNVEQTSISTTLAANVESLTGTGTADLTLTGNSQANTITANSGNDTLVAGSGIATLVGGTGNDTFVVNNSSDVIKVAVANAGDTVQTSVNYVLPINLLNLTGTGSGNLILTGNKSADTITANSGNDTLVAGSGVATLVGGAGNDTFTVNNVADVVTAQSNSDGSNVNTINSSVTYTASANVQDLIGTGTATITLTGNNGNDLIVGNSGTDTLIGGTGVDVLEAGSGTNTLKDTAGSGVLIAGKGNDTLIGGSGADFIVGGAGNDAITLGAGTAVVAFNTGDGKAKIAAGTGLSNVLSLGGGISYANLSFSKSGNNLILNTGGNNAITFTNWYAGAANQDFVTLQVLEQAAGTYDATSTNPLYNQEIEEFSFTQLVTAFNAALAATPTLTSWSLANTLLTAHLSGSNSAALGGDLAYYEGLNGNLNGMNLATAVSTLQNPSYGKTAQTVDAWSGISAGSNRLH